MLINQGENMATINRERFVEASQLPPKAFLEALQAENVLTKEITEAQAEKFLSSFKFIAQNCTDKQWDEILENDDFELPAIKLSPKQAEELNGGVFPIIGAIVLARRVYFAVNTAIKVYNYATS